jgi:hypothetical protein
VCTFVILWILIHVPIHITTTPIKIENTAVTHTHTCYPFIVRPYHSLIPKSLIYSHHYIFPFSRMLCKWNHEVCKLWNWLFLCSTVLFRSPQVVVYVAIIHSPLLWSVITFHTHIRFLFHPTIEEHLVVPSLGQLSIKSM